MSTIRVDTITDEAGTGPVEFANGINVNGTTVIDDSRGLTNIASVDAPTVAILKSAGLGGSSYVFKSANYTANAGDVVIPDTSGGVFTVSLPANPSTGDTVSVLGVTPYSAKDLTVSGNGKLIGSNTSYTNASSDTLLNFIYTGLEWTASKIVSDPLFAPELFIPDWNSPDITMTTSGTITISPTIADSKTCWVYLLGGGGCGNNTEVYQSGWGFGGSGGAALLYYTNVANIRGATCAIGAGKTASNTWQGTTGSSTRLTTNALEVLSTGTAGSLVYDASVANNVSGGLAEDAYIRINGVGSVSNISGLSNNSLVGGGNSGSGEDGGTPNWVFAASEGYGSQNGGAGGTTNGTSVFAGDGNSTNGVAGTYPGGGGAGNIYVNTSLGHGANGNVRIYIQP